MKYIYFLIIIIFITGCSEKEFDLLEEYEQSIDCGCNVDSDCIV
jgi:hypothetical protein